MAYICTKFYTGTKKTIPHQLYCLHCHSEIHLNGHNSVTITHCTKFGTETKNNVLEIELTSYFTSEKIQHGGGRHLKIGLMAISRSLWHIFAWSFTQGLKTIPHSTSNFGVKFNSCKIQDGCGRQFEIHINGHNSVIVERICIKFGIEKIKMAAAVIWKIGLMAICRSLWHIFERDFTHGLKTILL